MDQAPVLNGLCFDLLSFCQVYRAAAEVDVGGCQTAEAFVISAMVAMLDEGGDGGLKLALQIGIDEVDKAGTMFSNKGSATSLTTSLFPLLDPVAPL